MVNKTANIIQQEQFKFRLLICSLSVGAILASQCKGVPNIHPIGSDIRPTLTVCDHFGWSLPQSGRFTTRPLTGGSQSVSYFPGELTALGRNIDIYSKIQFVHFGWETAKMQINGAKKYWDKVVFKPIKLLDSNKKFDLKSILFVFVKLEYCYSIFPYATGWHML